jgi:hypothetical protein
MTELPTPTARRRSRARESATEGALWGPVSHR